MSKDAGETSFMGALIVDEPPLTEAQRSLCSLSKSIAFAHRNDVWSVREVKDWAIPDADPHDIRARVAGVLGDMLTPAGADLAVKNYYGRPLRLNLHEGSHLSHVAVGFSRREVPRQRVLLKHDAKALTGIDGITFEEVDAEHILAKWDERFRIGDWQGYVALAFWHKQGRPDESFERWQRRCELSERIELSSCERERGKSPLLTPGVGTPLWGGKGQGTEVFEAMELAPRRATETEALAFLGIVRHLVPDRWLWLDTQNTQGGTD